MKISNVFLATMNRAPWQQCFNLDPFHLACFAEGQQVESSANQV